MKTKIMFSFKRCKAFISQIVKYCDNLQKKRKTAKMGNYAQKSENFVKNLVVPKTRKPSVKTIGHKNQFFFL